MRVLACCLIFVRDAPPRSNFNSGEKARVASDPATCDASVFLVKCSQTFKAIILPVQAAGFFPAKSAPVRNPVSGRRRVGSHTTVATFTYPKGPFLDAWLGGRYSKKLNSNIYIT